MPRAASIAPTCNWSCVPSSNVSETTVSPFSAAVVRSLTVRSCSRVAHPDSTKQVKIRAHVVGVSHITVRASEQVGRLMAKQAAVRIVDP